MSDKGMMMRTLKLAAIVTAMFFASGLVSFAQTPEATPTVTMSPYVTGDAFNLIPEGEEDTVSVAIYGIVDSLNGNDGVVFVIRNNSEKDVLAINVVGTARTSDGKLFAVSENERVKPTRIVAGGIAVGSLTFLSTDLHEDLQIEFKISEDEHSDYLVEHEPGLVIDEASKIENRIVGQATNTAKEQVEAFIIKGVCFVDGEISGEIVDFLTDSSVDPDEAVPFQIELREACEQFLITIG